MVRMLLAALMVLVMALSIGCRFTKGGRRLTARPGIDCPSSPTGKGGPMCSVPEGTFMMGCDRTRDPGCDEDELPYHRVLLGPYLIDEHEVTVAEYAECMAAGACERPMWHRRWGQKYCNVDRPDRRDHPQNCVHWFHGDAYCRWAGKRLPTEAEWEKAARGTDGALYPWGNSPAASCDMAVVDDPRDGCGTNSTWPVCSLDAGRGPYGNCDMAGNTFEWTADWYDPGYFSRAPDPNPQGPDHGADKVLKGGSWNRWPHKARSSNRVGYPPDDNPFCRGFRCAYTPVGGAPAGDAPVGDVRETAR